MNEVMFYGEFITEAFSVQKLYDYGSELRVVSY